MSIGNVAKKEMRDFLNKKYYIPTYQREYAWEKDEILDFLSDIERILYDDRQKHFFGQVVVHDDQGANKKYIIDGQQRTITSIIFLRVLAVAITENINNMRTPSDSGLLGNDVSGEAIRTVITIENIIGRYEKRNNKDSGIKLELGKRDNAFFVEEIFKNDYPSARRQKEKSKERLRKAHFIITDYINDKINKYKKLEEKIACLDQYLVAFLERFEVLYIEATELNEAFVIFETLNARGKDLEMSDLLKNYIFSNTNRNNIEQAQRLWNKLLDNLKGIVLTDYIRHYWNASHELVRTNTLYRRVIQFTKGRDRTDELLNNLVKYSTIYHDLRFPREPIVIESDNLIDFLDNLKILNAKTFYPLILAMYQVNDSNSETFYEDKDIESVLEVIENYVFRNLTVCGRTANATEKFMGETALQVYCGALKTVDDICRVINKEIVSDEEFQAAFRELGKQRKEVIRYILRKLNQEISCGNEEINMDNNKVQLEHIMPSNNSKWNIDDEIHSEYLWRLGNLTLLSGKKNAEASNNLFKEKVELYKTSKIDLNETIWKDSRGKERKQWTERDIQDRQNLFAELAIKAWPRK